MRKEMWGIIFGVWSGWVWHLGYQSVVVGTFCGVITLIAIRQLTHKK